MWTGARVALILPLALGAIALVGGALFVIRWRTSPAYEDRHGAKAEVASATPGRPWLVGIALALAAVAAVLATVTRVPWVVPWAFALAAVASALVDWRARTADIGPFAPAPGWVADSVAAATSVLFAGMSLFITNPNADDIYYVNRAVATAQLGHIPVNDVIFTNEAVARSGGTGLPLDTFSALQGAVARILDVHAASVAYYLVPPIATFLATWALWRLTRAWAPRAHLACFLVGCVFWIWSAQPTPPGENALATGNFFLTRIWQGKVAFAAWMVPTLYVLLTRWLERSDALTAALLLLAAVASLGLTSSAPIVVPLAVSTAVLVAIARRSWTRLPLLLAAVAIVAVVGLVAAHSFPLVVDLGPAEKPTEWYYHAVFGAGVASAIGAFAVWSAPWLARRGVPAALGLSVALVATVLLAPGVLDLLHDLLDLNGSRVLRRTLWVAPLPALVGLFAAVPVTALLGRLGGGASRSKFERAIAVVPAAAISALLVAFGLPLWSADIGSTWSARPTWKTNARSVEGAREILARYDGPGPVLADGGAMGGISLLTAETKAVNPRAVYARRTREPRATIAARLVLVRLVYPRRGRAGAAAVSRALDQLAVPLVCVRPVRFRVIRLVEEAGPYRRAFRTTRHVCLEQVRGGA